MRTKKCKQCGADFSCVVGRGTTNRTYCSEFCRVAARAAERKARPRCTVDGCDNPRDYAEGICSSCYCRRRRTGTLERKQHKYRSAHSSGYVRVMVKGHPLADRSGYVLEHRQVLYDRLGPHPQSCYWCGVQVAWAPGPFRKGASRLRLVVDHLDGNKANNSPENLVVACNDCNGNRGLFMRWVLNHQDDPVLWSMYEASRAKRAVG